MLCHGEPRKIVNLYLGISNYFMFVFSLNFHIFSHPLFKTDAVFPLPSFSFPLSHEKKCDFVYFIWFCFSS